MTTEFSMPAVGSSVEIVIDSSHVNGYLAEGHKHLVGKTTTLRGTVVATPKWFQNHVCLINSDTRATNHVPVHRIISINKQQVTQPKVTADLVLTVPSSKGTGVYTVTQNGVTKQWVCSCPGHVWKKTCRHVKEAQLKHA